MLYGNSYYALSLTLFCKLLVGKTQMDMQKYIHKTCIVIIYILYLVCVCMQVPRSEFYTCSLSGVVASQLGPFGHKPDILSELLAGK